MRRAIFLLAIGLFGCSERDISFETGYIKKSQFEGEWIAHATTVAKQSHSSFAFTGLSCPAERVKFVITKDQLLAFKSEEAGAFDEESREQALVAAFNIVDTVSTKSPKDKNGFIKVDWSKNLAPHVECSGWLSAITSVSVKNNELKDPLDPFRLRIEDDYMENTVDAIVIPDEETCEEIEEWRCNPAEYRVKYSFKKIPLGNDYEPWNYADNEKIRFGINNEEVCIEGEPGCNSTQELWLYSDHRREVMCDPLKHDIDECYAPSIDLNANFGFFRTRVQSYDRKAGFDRRELKTYINRQNLWQKSVNEDQTMIPLAKRVPKKIVYYLNPGFPQKLLPAVKKVEKEWSLAFANVVAKLKDGCSTQNVLSYLAAEPKLEENFFKNGIKTVGSYNLKKACSLVFDWTKDRSFEEVFFTGDPKEVEQVFGQIFEIKVNDCNEQNIKAYAKTHGLESELSKNGISLINDDNMEKACAVLELFAKDNHLPEFKWQQLGDIRYSFVNGITHPDGNLLGYGPSVVDPKTGEIISATANIYLAAISQYATKSVSMMEDLTELQGDLSTENEDDSIDDFKEFVVGSVGSMSNNSYQMPKTRSFQMANLAKAAKLNVFPDLHDWSKYLNETDTGIEGLLSALSEEKESLTKKNRIAQFFSERSACFFEPLDNLPYVRLTNELKQLSIEQRIDLVKAEIFASTLMHELGHTFGLRHNFKAKSDALNYPPNFWDVDTQDFRMRQGLAKEEMRSSSAMDYHKRFNGDFFGLGLYDYAAILLGYGKKLEVFDTREENFVPGDFVEALSSMSYRDLPYIFSGNDANQKIKNHFLEVKDEFLRGKKSAHMQLDKLGLKRRPENLYKRSTVDYVDLKKQKLFEALGAEVNGFTAVPYGFCTDGQARKNDMFCQPFIYGASASEIIENQIKDYEIGHAIRRINGRNNLSGVGPYLRSVYGNVYAPILRSYQRMYASAGTTRMIFPAVHDYALGAKRGLSFISEVLQAVEPGEYCQNAEGNYEPKGANQTCASPIQINNLLGKRYQSSFNDDLVSSPKSIGYIYDKILAMLALIDDSAVLGDDFEAWRNNIYSIGFYRVFAPQFINLFKSMFTDHWSDLAPSIVVENDKVHIKYRDLFKPKNDITENGPKILPSHSSSLKDYAILFSMTGLSNPVDHKLNFAKRAQIRATTFHKDNEKDEMVFVDPNTKVRYRAAISEEKELSLGYHLIKDAHDFVSQGQDQAPGSWYVAQKALAEAKANFEQEQSARNKNKIKLASLGKDLKILNKDFADKDRVLREKVRVIEKVRALSEKFAD